MFNFIYLFFSPSTAVKIIVSAARSLTCRDDLDSKWRLLLAENELSRVYLLSRISIGIHTVVLSFLYTRQ